ncbi:MAG TPA: tetratricopeptide repeat-containing sensor histidine kinase [Prolixibacteraceae bacterium]|nr:tetratricopeptide repeat-containing sensor histidine kinase [Prolixibacteraceae bacterium]
MKNVTISFFLCLISASTVWPQTNRHLDSLLAELQKPHHDTVVFELLLAVGDDYCLSDLEKGKAYFIEAKERTENSLEKSPENLKRKYLQQKAKALRYIAWVYMTQGDLITASDLYFQALEIGESIQCDLNIYNCYNNIAIINHKRKEYTVAREYYTKAIEITERTGNRYGRMKLFNNMGVLYHDLGNETHSKPVRDSCFQEARENFQNALQLRIEFKDLWGQVLCYNNLGNLSRDEARHIEDESLIGEKIKEADIHYRKSLQLAQQIDDVLGVSKACGNLSELYLFLFDSLRTSDPVRQESWADSAVYYAAESYRYATRINSLTQKNESALAAKKAYAADGNITKALEYADIYIQTSADLFSEDKTRSLDEMRIKYETKKKEDEIALLSKENELNEIRINHARKEKAMFILIAFSLLILSGLLYILYTIRKRTNKLLKEKNKELHLLNSTKDKFISILAHDLKNPFSAFLNISETLHNEFDEIDMERKKKYIERIYEASKQINNLLKNILQWAVIQNNPRKIETTLLNLHETTNEVCRTLAPYIQEHNVQVENFIPPGIQVYANRTFLITILNNLITNAVKFSENGNPVQVSASADKRAACVTVTDQGIGIAPQDIEKLFRMDIDTHTIGTSKEKGSGMGLILCKELIEKMNGTIWAESNTGGGSRFLFTIPLHHEYTQNRA